MVSPDNILLRLVPEQEDYVREVFAELAERGFPPQQQTPHITMTFATVMPESVVRLAQELLPPLLPLTVRRSGVAIFGTKSKQTVSWLLDAPPALHAAARELAAANPDTHVTDWIPHITVGLRLPRAMVGEYVAALDEVTSGHFRDLHVARAVVWSSRTDTLRELN
ncbi:2'-5' RNA ligase family protein [Corynebacterium renale]|uniref:2'-5' RNA ligase superfamily protein n=1 Tax=Corynebacterium renale TaxID=1724 RepID=A0A2A9DL37_9CORY|nr:2'-5' RNA ligase family protein [Corynebacterium renale]PFG27304.1 2'-5' RNA ligase superfamily protein [Corynebacterium renale]SQI23610.1 2',5' RNA ligase family [Corynebacterium renale]